MVQLGGSLAASAPSLDIKLFSDIRSFAAVDSIVSNAAIKAFSRHTWYLTGELILLALWDPDTAPTEKQTLARKIATLASIADDEQFTMRFGTEFGKPKMVDLQKIPGDEMSLCSLANADSKMFFKVLQIPTDFLKNL